MEQTKSPVINEEDTEDDPLEAYMLGIYDQVEKESKTTTTQKETIRRDDIEDEDFVESYVNHMKKKGIEVGKSQKPMEKDENVNSDEEVYATARAIDAQLEYDSDDNPIVEQKRKDVEPLAPVEHPEIASLSDDRIKQLQVELDMHVSGVDAAKPCISFAHFGFDEALLDTIIKYGYSEPTGIQKQAFYSFIQALPVALSGRDIIGIAKTGSGKTAAFIWPMLIHIMDQEELKKVAAVYGGASKMDQFKELRQGNIEILVGTPGRLIDMVKMKATNFRRVSFLVLDEADRMFDLGFEPQVRSICDNIRPDRQTLLFSATFPKKVEKLAREVTTEPIRISIGNIGQANTDITQVFVILTDDGYKWDWLISNLVALCVDGSVLIFVSRKGGVDELSLNLRQAGHECGALHGDMMQSERDKVLKDFKNSKFSVLVATDVAARGLDIKSVKTVINYDIARDIDSHVHRIGRTGRAGEKGTAYTFITKKEDKFAGDLVRNLELAGQIVPTDLMDLAMQNNRFRKSRNMIRGRRGGKSGRGRGRGGSGRGAVGSSSNSIPLGGGRAGIGSDDGGRSSGGVQIPPPPHLDAGPPAKKIFSKIQMNFHKATSAESGLGLLRSTTANSNTQSPSNQSQQSTGTLRKRRWDSK
ncbi:7179_t:CDS:10 [Entrophospora sp. SA101]|nr:7179_t:CDS:10 [Entrophospora sp. SA101]